MVQVHRVRFERACGLLFAIALVLGRLLLLVLLLRGLGDAVCNVVDNVEPRHATLVQEVDRVGFLLAEDRHQHVGAGHFLLARGLHVQDRALDHALKPLRRLGVRVRVRRQPGRVLVDEVGQDSTQLLQVDAAGFEHFGGGRVVEHGEKQVLDGDELVLLLPCLDKSHMEGDFQFLRDHDGPDLDRSARADLAQLPRTDLTPTSPPWCTGVDAGACGRCSAPDRPLLRRLPACKSRTPPSPRDELVT